MGILAVGVIEHLICIIVLAAISLVTSIHWPVLERVGALICCIVVYVCTHLLIESFRKGKNDETKEIDSSDGADDSDT